MCAPDAPPAAARARAARRRSSWRLGATVALSAALPCAVLRLAAPAQAQPPLIQAWVALGADCHGGRPDDPKTAKACKKREQVGERLKRRGCVYQEDGDWWKCPH